VINIAGSGTPGNDNPHNHGSGDLVSHERDVKWIRLFSIISIDWTAAEGKKSRERCIGNVGAYKIENHNPSG